jgi:tetratricopeptide (TPR) repeat protein
VAVRLTGGNDITPEVKEFMSRYGVRGYPTLYVMNADGHVVVADVKRSVDEMLKALADGEKAETEFAEAKKKTDDEGRKALAGILKQRMAWDDLAALQEADVKASPSAESYAELAKTYASAGRAADERKTLEKAIDQFKDAKQRTPWRIRLATMEHDPSKAASRDEFISLGEQTAKDLEGLLAKLEAEKDTKGAVDVRAALGSTLLQIGKADDAEKHFDAVLSADPKGAAAPTALMGKANCAWSRKDYAGCKAHLEKIVADFPDSEEGKIAPRGIKNCEAQIAKQKK